jgi:hypothetical protein
MGRLADGWPFFDDCHLIFLAPISCFDQVLAEDRRVNRLVRRLRTLFPKLTLTIIPSYGTLGRLPAALESCLFIEALAEFRNGSVLEQVRHIASKVRHCLSTSR